MTTDTAPSTAAGLQLPDPLPEYGRAQRSSARVTADRLRKHAEDDYPQFTSRELDAIERVLLGLDAIDRGER